MRQLILRLFCLISILSAVGIVTPHTAYALGDVTKRTQCQLGTSLIAWGGSAAVHPNGLLYVAKSVSPYESMDTKAYIAIFALNPDSAAGNPDGTCSIVATYQDSTENYTAYSVKLNPSVLASDNEGNLYIGKGSSGGFRLLFIPANAPANAPFTGLTARKIPIDVRKKSYSYSGLGVTDSHVVIGMSSWTPGETFDIRYASFSSDLVKSNSAITPAWASLGSGNGTVDAFTGMSNGQFFLTASLVSNGKLVIGAAFLNPNTNVITNPFNPTLHTVAIVDCRPASGLGFVDIFGCAMPTAAMGADDNLYFTMHVIQRGDIGRAQVAMRYEIATNTWKGLGSFAKPTIIDYLNNIEAYGGTAITADASGNVIAGIDGDYNTKIARFAFLNVKTGVWSTGTPMNGEYPAFGKPSINIIDVGGEPRISFIYVTERNAATHGIYWTTYSAPVNGVASRCRANVVLEGGAAFINRTNASGAIYTGATCTATRYIAVASTSETPPTNPSSSDIKTFSQANGTFSVSGLVAGSNYVHIRLYDANNPLENWVTNQITVDADSTVGATVALSTGNNTPSFKDQWSMRGSSYSASGYTRSPMGELTITGVTDASGLNSYKINDQPEVQFDSNKINQPIPAKFDSITSTVVISLTLTDGATNSEVRGIRPFTYDVTPPTVSSAPSATFTAATGVFSGTIGLTGGTITDDLYSASGRQYWGVWVANAKCVGDVVGGCPTDTASQLRWGAVPVTNPTSIQWNLLHGLNQVPSSGLYRTYIRFLDGAGNASTTAVTVDTTVTMTTNKIYMPLNFSQR